MTQRSNIVRLRLTDLEKQDWQRAAGGARKLSEWIRSVCNTEVAATLEEGVADAKSSTSGGMPAQVGTPASSVVPKPKVVEDAIERSLEGRGGELKDGGSSGHTSGDETPAAAPRASSDQCPRWMYHRPGVYCGTCKKVIGK